MKSKLKIAVNTRLLLKDKLEGIGYFEYETLQRITRGNPDVEFHFLFDRSYEQDFIFSANIKPVVLFPPARHPFLWYWWFEWSVAAYLRKNNFDLFLSPDGYVSLRSDTPTLAVQHDIAFEHYPDFVPGLYGRYYKYYVPKFLQHAARIATVSEYSKGDMVKQYGTDPAKIDVVYSAAKDVFKPIDENEKKEIRSQYTDSSEYVIYVGSIHPRKNLKNMLLAFDEFRKNTAGAAHKFLVVGAFGWQNSGLKAVIDSMQFRNDVIFLGRQPLDILANLIAASFVLLYVSLFEGFGVPPLEGMKCGVPVITSATSSMPEICGDAALLADPMNVTDISDAIGLLFASPNLYARLCERGPKQAQKYSWDICADLLWASCLKTIGTKVN
jgi:glycosyltransferase involved in cell wall biosynthesis